MDATTAPDTKNRETWLRRMLAEKVIPHISADQIFISVGLPLGGARPHKRTGRYTIGQCFHGEHQGGNAHIFIHPDRDIPMSPEGEGIIETMIHEVLHAALPTKNEKGKNVGHGPIFAKAAIACGLTGKPSSTIAGPELVALAQEWVAEIGPYPHKALNLPAVKVQGTRMVKVQCQECGFCDEQGRGYTLRTTVKWIDVGTPICPCGNIMAVIFEKGDEPIGMLKAKESSTVFEVPNEDEDGIDPDFEIRRTTGSGGERWTVIYYGSSVARTVERDGETYEVPVLGTRTARMTAVEGREDALETIDNIRAGYFTWDDIASTLEEIADEDDDDSNPLADEEPSQEEIDAVLYEDDETADYPEDQDAGEWVHPIKGTVVKFNYDEVAASREK
jgi:hypothetical protein